MAIERFRVPEVSCQHCVAAITKEVTALPGVRDVRVDLADKVVIVEHDAPLETAEIVGAINEAGYDEVSKI